MVQTEKRLGPTGHAQYQMNCVVNDISIWKKIEYRGSIIPFQIFQSINEYKRSVLVSGKVISTLLYIHTLAAVDDIEPHSILSHYNGS